MTRDRSLGKGPSPHDTTGAPSRGDRQRPITRGFIKPPVKGGGARRASKGCAVLALLALSLSTLGLAGLAALIT